MTAGHQVQVGCCLVRASQKVIIGVGDLLGSLNSPRVRGSHWPWEAFESPSVYRAASREWSSRGHVMRRVTLARRSMAGIQYSIGDRMRPRMHH
jgi:hypothetical protein